MPFDERGRAALEQFQITAAYISSHPRLAEVVEELEDSPDTYNRARQDARNYLQTKGFELPEGWTVRITHDSPITITVCVNGWCLSYTLSLEVTHEP